MCVVLFHRGWFYFLFRLIILLCKQPVTSLPRASLVFSDLVYVKLSEDRKDEKGPVGNSIRGTENSMCRASKMGPSAVGLRSGMEADMKSQSLTGDCWGWGQEGGV